MMIPLSPHEPLIHFLNKHFPPLNPDPSMSQQVIMYEAGKRYLIEYLLDELVKQQEEAITSSKVIP